MKKAVGFFLAFALLGLLAQQIYSRAMEQSGSRPGGGPPRGGRSAAVAVELAPVTTGSIRDVVEFTGSLTPRSYFVVAPKVAGRLDKLTVNIGDRVRRGQLIAVLDDEELTRQLQQAAAELKIASARVGSCRSELDVSKREFERYEGLVEKGVSSAAELDIARAKFEAGQAECDVALAQVAQKQAALKVAEVRRSYTKIHATWPVGEGDGNGDGEVQRVVGERFVDQGALLAPNAPVVSVMDISSVTAAIHVIERDYSLIVLGQGAVVTTDAFPGREFRGKVARLAPMLKETSRQARAEIEIANPDEALKPGMFIRARIQFAKHEKATLVPVAALAKRGGKVGVFIADVDAKKARFVPLTIGIEDGDVAEVLSPELTGFVVTLGQHLLEDGAALMLPKPQPSQPPQPTQPPRDEQPAPEPGTSP